MSVTIRAAHIPDVDAMANLLLEDAGQRQITNGALWRLTADAREKVTSALMSALQGGGAPFRQKWLLAEAEGRIVGLTHTILLPVPPIYAGELGAPGLIMEDCHVSADAPAGTAGALLTAAETDLIDAGAKILLASSVSGGAWEVEYAARNYQALTLYLAKTCLTENAPAGAARKSTDADISPIVTLSAANRRILFDLDVFWKPHAEADVRFGHWMKRSLTLTDRDLFVSEAEGEVDGYAIAQPATPLHFPPAHDIGATGVIDDFYHLGFQDPARLDKTGQAAGLLATAEAALSKRRNDAALIVCPAAWKSKIELLEAAGYGTAIVWHIRR